MDTPPPKTTKVKYTNPTRLLQDRCEKESNVVVAERVFPNSKYTWYYPKTSVIIVRSVLDLNGDSSEIKTEMSSKSSKLILSVRLREPVVEESVKGDIVNK